MLKKILYFIIGYVLVLSLIALINRHSQCHNIFIDNCSPLDKVQLILLIPVAIPVVVYEAFL
ncbi:hypothetical protein P255_00340 [Acinetobacter brisouii CIP 110357]|uniref:Uncharacterized protein n=1 Tax=Acinetobacter brisouii CIP 110357 TaxID=1341683 RepID=V2UU59_9GAMM|nr:hypothetical protein [Acinetobacter brisouii]ENV48480.1 hypothetical protein F954_00564 [Acinetobacter brisouii ANC 4119]ESK52195.1 hypothetical protein P255_00340 [Acinetobacter brisouii CIP 110357]